MAAVVPGDKDSSSSGSGIVESKDFTLNDTEGDVMPAGKRATDPQGT